MKPILFNTEMVRAILEGRKTVTRRLVKFEKGKNPKWTGYIKDGLTLYNGRNEPCSLPVPYKVGDVLYVRETWCKWYCYDCGMDEEAGKCNIGNPIYDTEREEYFCYTYRANFDADPFDGWKPSIHMPKEAARLFLRVTGIRVERLQDITEEQATKEGCQSGQCVCKGAVWGQEDTDEWTAKEALDQLWDITLGRKDTPEWYANNWSGNPYVWVIEFEVISKSEALGGSSPEE